MTIDRRKLYLQTAKENIAILESIEEPDDVGYYLQLEYEKFVAECIEKQIPKKPVKKNPVCYQKTADEEKYAYDYHCPMCDIKLIPLEHHCLCGQALDWSDTE